MLDAARAYGPREALFFEGRRWTFAQLGDDVRRAMTTLRARAVTPGARVVLSARNRPETLVFLLAVAELGATVVPLHPRLTERERAGMIADAEPTLVLGDDDLTLAATPCTDAPTLHADAPMAMLYTSGTTGTPKAAVLTRAAFEASARASEANLGWRDDDRWLLCLPLCHIGGLSVVTRCVMAGRAVVLLARFDIDGVLAALEAERVTLMSVVPTMLRGLLAADVRGVMRQPRAVLVGGAAASEALLAEAVARGVRVLATYGLTEACSQVTTWPRSADDRARVCPGSGRALAGLSLRVVDDEERVLSAGQIGRIQVRGPTLMVGYRGRPPIGASWFDTGDLGSLDEGENLHVAARRTDLIVTGGENVYPAEVEGVLEAMPGVERAVVFGVDDAHWGQLVAAAIVCADDPSEAQEQALWKALTEALARHKWPRRVCFVRGVPLRSTGKVDRAESVRTLGPLVRAWRQT